MEAAVNAALEDTRVVLVNGARQSGKSTLVRLVAKSRDVHAVGYSVGAAQLVGALRERLCRPTPAR